MKPTQGKRKKIYDKYNGRCAYCGETPTELTLDHINPEARGGTWKLNNLNPACLDCNQAKSYLTIEAFRQEIFKRSNPLYMPPVNHIIRRWRKRHPDTPIQIKQPDFWVRTIKRFSSPVVFYFEHKPRAIISNLSDEKLYQAVVALLTPKDPAERSYASMAGWGFSR